MASVQFPHSGHLSDTLLYGGGLPGGVAKITFYGGVGEIGGNQILVEDKGTRVFVDFGMPMGRSNSYFAEFLRPRALNGMGDLIELGLLPRIKGAYRRDYSRHTKYGDHESDTEIDGVLLSHAHVDHCSYIHYLRPDIPVYCSKESHLIMKCFQDTGGGEEYVRYKENFRTYRNRNGGISRAKDAKNREEVDRKFETISPGKEFNIDSIKVEALPVDHSLPGTYAFILHTSAGTVAYTADLRYHGRRRRDTERFVRRCASADVDTLLCEGTRIDVEGSKTEADVETGVAGAVAGARQLAVCSYPVRDLDRFLSIYNAAAKAGRDMVVDMKQAYLLRLFRNEGIKAYPAHDDPRIRIFVPRKSWGLYGRPASEWPQNIVDADYAKWERELAGMGNAVGASYVRENQRRCLLYCSDFGLANLIDVQPSEGSVFVRSQTEPFDEEMELDHRRVKRWLDHFKLIEGTKWAAHHHVSGHGTGDQIRRVVKGASARRLIPIHTTHPGMFKKLHGKVRIAGRGKPVRV